MVPWNKIFWHGVGNPFEVEGRCSLAGCGGACGGVWWSTGQDVAVAWQDSTRKQSRVFIIHARKNTCKFYERARLELVAPRQGRGIARSLLEQGREERGFSASMPPRASRTSHATCSRDQAPLMNDAAKFSIIVI